MSWVYGLVYFKWNFEKNSSCLSERWGTVGLKEALTYSHTQPSMSPNLLATIKVEILSTLTLIPSRFDEVKICEGSVLEISGDATLDRTHDIVSCSARNVNWWYLDRIGCLYIRHSPIYWVISFLFLLLVFSKYESQYFYWVIFFLFLLLVFFSTMSQYFCSSDIVRIHHLFSLLFYIIFPFSSNPSLVYRFVYVYL